MSDYSGVIANREERIEMEIKRTKVTPELAKKLLGVNYEGQRNISKAHVKKLASDMANGRWVETGSTIVISKSGKLIDGQHRLEAVIDSGVTVPMCICTGVEDEAYIVIDSGKKRSTGDAIGGKNANVKGSLASAGAKLAAGGGLSTVIKGQSVTTAAAVEYYQEHADAIEDVATYYTFVRHKLGKASTLGVGLGLYLFYEKAPEVVEYIVDGFGDIVPSDPCVASYKAQCQQAIVGDRFDVKRQLAMTIRLCEAVLDDKEQLGKITRTDNVIEKMDAKIDAYRKKVK